ncbi:MAG: hypothetical protein RIB86_20855 [Imperialibacter sp.]
MKTRQELIKLNKEINTLKSMIGRLPVEDAQKAEKLQTEVDKIKLGRDSLAKRLPAIYKPKDSAKKAKQRPLIFKPARRAVVDKNGQYELDYSDAKVTVKSKKNSQIKTNRKRNKKGRRKKKGWSISTSKSVWMTFNPMGNKR